ETLAAPPLGTIVTAGTVTVGNSVAPTGTTVFAGDKIAAMSQPALINLVSGSRIEMTKAVMTLSRRGKSLVVQANEGLLRFNFLKGEEVEINAGRYRFTAVGGDSAHIGELGLNKNGQVALAVTEGIFASQDTVSGERKEVTPKNQPQTTLLEGKGRVTKNGNTVTVITEPYNNKNELKGKCIVAGNDAGKDVHSIESNTETIITISGSWKLKSATYDYKITNCNKEALVDAGAEEGAAGVAAIAAGAAAAVGLGVGINAATKSVSSR
ncbi:MAG TPA: hypothetical protein VLX12_00115, partial [Syntrophorhabdales bacterium]|nr:hypothetical protein [Syntrophorhabdales bacterium]